MLHRLARSVNDLLATAGDPLGKTRVRHPSVSDNRTLRQTFRILKKKMFVKDSWLCTGTKKQQETSNVKVSFSSRWDVCSSTAKVLVFGVLDS